MNLCLENETDRSYDFKLKETAESVINEVLSSEGVRQNVDIELLLTGREEIRRLNREFRDTDKETDVLSFPNLDFDKPSDLSCADLHPEDYTDPDSGNIYLGDIVINVYRMEEQAKSYGHGIKREFAFLTAHSMLHLLGYDHMTEDEERVMFEKQEFVLNKLGIIR